VPLDAEFVADCPYGPGGLLIDEVVEIDVEKSMVRVRMPVHPDLPLTREQRNHPVFHPPHLSGGLMVHMTGMVGFVHAYYVFGLRHADGWVGYGVRIHHARFQNLGEMHVPLVLKGWSTNTRKSPTKILARYTFEFTQGSKLIYEGDQTALWTRITRSRKRSDHEQPTHRHPGS
jgi:hypothetical protein